MGDVVSDGESLSCPFCTAKIKLGVSSSAVESDSKKIANTNNHSFSAPGAQCIVVPSAPKPCQPSGQNVDPGQSPLSVDGSSALGAGCKWMCAQGGLITISSAAQSSMIHDGAAGAESYKPPEGTSRIEPNKAANAPSLKQKTTKFRKAKPKKSHAQRKIDNQKPHLTYKDLRSAQKESKGEVVKIRERDGKPYDHVQEVRDAQRGLKNAIVKLKQDLKDYPAANDNVQKVKELSEASKWLDQSETFLPSTPLKTLTP
jgi:hypothetical protein